MRVETRLLKLSSHLTSSEYRVELPNVTLPCVCINPFSVVGDELEYSLIRDGNLFPLYGVKPQKGFAKANVAFMAGVSLKFIQWDEEPPHCVGLIGLVKNEPMLYASLLFPGTSQHPRLVK